MSQICIGKTNEINTIEFKNKLNQLKLITELYGYNVYPIDWHEPFVESLKNCFAFSIGDRIWGDCEPLLLPDGDYLGNFTNNTSFENRMKLLYEVARLFVSEGHELELFIGWSGDQIDDFDCYYVELNGLIPLLVKTIGKHGGMFNSIHVFISTR